MCSKNAGKNDKKRRLEWWLENRNLMPRSQYGFRKGKGTLDNMFTLHMDISSAIQKKQTVVAAFLDVKGAYDNVNTTILLNKLARIGIPSRMIYGISTMIAQRTIYVRFKGNTLGPYFVSQGLPQGAILSPLLYTLYTHDLECTVLPPTKILQYADDICVYSTNNSYLKAKEELLTTIDHIIGWLFNNGLELSADKSVVVPFYKSTSKPKDDNITCGKYTFQVISHTRFLGLIFDSRLSWIPHIPALTNTCEKGLNIIHSLTHVWWGGSSEYPAHYVPRYHPL